MNAIVAVDREWGIGKNGQLLTHLPEDMKFFREKTTDMNIVIGRKTLESFPGGKPLPDRHNIVITTNENYLAEGCTVCLGIEALRQVLSEFPDDEIFVCGGERVYKEMLPFADTLWVTKIDAVYGADKFFPDVDADEDFEVTWESEEHEYKGTKFRFTKYERKQS